MRAKVVKIMIIGNKILRVILKNLIKNHFKIQENLRVAIQKMIIMMIEVKWINLIRNFRKKNKMILSIYKFKKKKKKKKKK